jgi:hypothetical protein
MKRYKDKHKIMFCTFCLEGLLGCCLTAVL